MHEIMAYLSLLTVIKYFISVFSNILISFYIIVY